MQPPTEPDVLPTSTLAPPRGGEGELFRRHHRDLERAVARIVNAPRELIEDACQNAWTILLRSQPDRYAIFAWLRVVAIHEAHRLSAIQDRDARLDQLTTEDANWHDVIADPRTLDGLLEAREALCLLAGLPERQRDDLALVIAGFSYREIAEMTGGRTYTNVSKHLTKARARIRSRARTARASPRARYPPTPATVVTERCQRRADPLFKRRGPTVHRDSTAA